jgi:hypothetical protein
MEELAQEMAEQVQFLFVYTREAHPGELFPPQTTYEQKVRHAQAFVERGQGVHRPMLIDTLDGQTHRLYGGVSNMSWIIDHTGRVAYKASWTDVKDIRYALGEVLEIRNIKRAGGRVQNFYREFSGVRLEKPELPPGTPSFLGGQKAVEDVRRYREAHPGEDS